MARRSRGPWLRTEDNCYYTKIGGRQVKLGSADEPWQTIEQAYHEQRAKRKRGPDPLFGHLVELFLEDCRKTREIKTYNWYKTNLDPFVKHFGARRRAGELTPGAVEEWAEGQSAGKQNAAARVVARVCNWAVTERRLAANPLAKMIKPQATSRESIITHAQYALCIKRAYPALADVLRFMWRTGCRPQEVRAIEAAWRDGTTVIFPQHSSKGTRRRKGKKRRRVIYLTEMPEKIVIRLSRAHPSGPIFRNGRGRPWTKDALNLAFRRLRDKTGITDLCPYTLRHTWITNKLKAGVDVATVAALSGNTVRTILINYEHVARDVEHLMAAMSK